MNRQTFLFLLLLIIFLDLPRGGVDGNSEKNLAVLARYRDSLKQARTQLTNAEYFAGYGNLTGLQLSYDDGLAHRNISDWPFRNYTLSEPWKETQQDSLLPNAISAKVRQFWARDVVTDSGPAYMLNISSDLYGEFEMPEFSHPISPIAMPLPPYLNAYYNSYRQARYDEQKERFEQDPENNSPPQELPESPEKAGNITTYKRGKLAVRIQSLASAYPDLDVARLGLELHEDTTLVHVDVEISDAPHTDRNEFAFFAVYFQKTGSLVGLTRSGKFMGSHAMPHFAMGEENFRTSQALLVRLLSVADIDKDISLDDVTTTVERAKMQCELVMYMQLKKTRYTKAELQFIDDELRLRQGLPLPKTLPQVEVEHALLYSPDCGVVFEKTPDVALAGVRSEVRLSQLRVALVGVFFLTAFELQLFMRQARASRTPSDLSNVSKLTIGLLSGYDSVVAVLMMSIMWVSDLYLICACNTVLNLLLFYVFELRYYASVEAAQSNESGASWWQILQGSTTAPTTNTNANDTTNTLNTTEGENTANTANAAPQPAPTPAPAPAAAVAGPASSSVVSYFAFSIICSFGVSILILNASAWSVHAIRIFEYTLLLAVNSYWVPQFLRNTLKNRSQALPWEFVLGTSFVRLAPLAYLCLYRSNPFRHPHNPVLLMVVFSWQAVQILLLFLQSKLGARFWLNSKWLPEQYNYHPLLSINDLESGFSRDIIANLKVEPESEVSMHESDCAICMSPLKFPILTGHTSSRKSYEALMKGVMITPCYHSFHTECLEDWMIYKLQCPVCRTSLPPV